MLTTPVPTCMSNASQLLDLAEDRVDHVFCCARMLSGLPPIVHQVIISTASGQCLVNVATKRLYDFSSPRICSSRSCWHGAASLSSFDGAKKPKRTRRIGAAGRGSSNAALLPASMALTVAATGLTSAIGLTAAATCCLEEGVPVGRQSEAATCCCAAAVGWLLAGVVDAAAAVAAVGVCCSAPLSLERHRLGGGGGSAKLSALLPTSRRRDALLLRLSLMMIGR